MTAKPPTAPSISGLLARAGFTRSDRVTRWAGFVVLAYGHERVVVSHAGGSDGEKRAALALYAEAIRAAGRQVAEADHPLRLIVTAAAGPEGRE